MKNGYFVKGKIVDVNNRRVFNGAVLVQDDVIFDIIEINEDCENYIMPGFVDSHIHIESSMLIPSEFAKIAVKHGTVATVSDPHEIANVLGRAGVRYMINDASRVPLKIFFGLPSCVPATNFETAGATINARTTAEMIKRKELWYLSEMMNFPGVINRDPEVMKKIEAAHKTGKPVDGHAPGLRGEALKKYVSAGISTDHECFMLDEALEKIGLGMKVIIRQGSAAKNLPLLYPIIDQHPDMVMLCSDDLHPDDLLRGHVNLLVADLVSRGCDLFNVLRAATCNPIIHYKLPVGLLRKGDKADFVVLKDLKKFEVLETYINGKAVYSNGNVNIKFKNTTTLNNFKRKPISISDLELKTKRDAFPVIVALDGQLITKRIDVKPKLENGSVVSDVENDVLKIAVVNRYSEAPVSIGLIKNFGFKRGAIAGSIAHDSHNVVAVGVSDADLMSAINAVVVNKGGIAVADGGVVESLPLNVAGLMSNRNAKWVANEYEYLTQRARELGSSLHAPFMTLSFMALLVIPEFKIGDKGLFDGVKFEFVGI